MRSELNNAGDHSPTAVLLRECAARAVDQLVSKLRRRPIVQPEWLSLQEAAVYCGYSEAQFSDFVKRGIAPPSVSFSRNARRFKRADVDYWCATGGPSQFKSNEEVDVGHPDFIVVEGPRSVDAKFFGDWLLAAAKAEALWQEALKDCDYAKQVQGLRAIYIPDMAISGTTLLSKLVPGFDSFVLDLNEEMLPLEFAMMVGMGFFECVGRRYRMAIPTRLELETVKNAALRTEQTIGDDASIELAELLTTMSQEQAKRLQDAIAEERHS